MYASNEIILNTEMGYDAAIVLSDDYANGNMLALVQQGDTLKLMRAFPEFDPTDTLLPESIIEAGAEYSRAGHTDFKVWAAGELKFGKAGEVFVGKQLVGMYTATGIELYGLRDLIKRAFH
ncbi:hypothetical protein pEaSNUABM54_00147 [Erwinia phage pEa_SNUABM_54]|nr:hypothetical protein pEaSNUABM54_00147 [Erwinia phage pEa_SNUABM_54]